MWHGKWHTDFGELNLEQDRNDVTGTYSNRGYIEAVSRNYGNKHILEGKFTNGSKQGYFKFTSIDDGNFSGNWKWSTSNNWDGAWDGEKISTIPRLHWQGSWDTNYGTLNLNQQGHKVTGSYSDLGIIDATASQDGDNHILEGRFTNTERAGTFKFTSNTDDKNFTGEWYWNGSNSKDGSWKGKRISRLYENSWQGKWETSFGDLNLERNGGIVTGTYANRGYIDAIAWGKEKEQILEGEFTNNSKKGMFKFISTISGKFQGKWKWNTSKVWDGEWDGKLSSTIPIFIWQGMWNTKYGLLDLNQRGNKVTGIYADKGIFDATASQDGNTHILKGRFTNKDKEGVFIFTSDNQGEFSGTWEGRGSSSSSGTWSGTKI